MRSTSTYLFISLFALFSLLSSFTNAATIEIRNQCPYVVWAAAIPGGGRRLERGQTWIINVTDTTPGRVWGRTNCNFDGRGTGRCATGDCNGLLECNSNGLPPNTIAEYAFRQSQNLDYFDISLVDGFNIPMDFSGCRGIRCVGDINGQCPDELKVPGGCNNPCAVFKTKEYCCTQTQESCEPTNFSRFFKDRCPTSYSYPRDDLTSTFTCPSGTNYRIVFCPMFQKSSLDLA